MNVETKYIIRWGIPGWVFIMIIFLFYNIIYHPNLIQKIDLVDMLSILVAASFIGVPVGYLFHQIYFSVNWLRGSRTFDEAVKLIEDKEKIIKNCWGENSHKDYFWYEYIWQKEMLKLAEDKRTYLSERYRHYLNMIHSLGALCVSLVFSLAGSLFLYAINFDKMGKTVALLLIFIILINIYLLIAVLKGFKYYSNNLNHFQGYILNDCFKGTFDCKNNKNSADKK